MNNDSLRCMIYFYVGEPKPSDIAVLYVDTVPNQPDTAWAEPSSLCKNDTSETVKLITDTIDNNGYAVWFTMEGDTIGKGNTLIINNFVKTYYTTTTFYVLWQNHCGDSDTSSVTVTVNEPIQTYFEYEKDTLYQNEGTIEPEEIYPGDTMKSYYNFWTTSTDLAINNKTGEINLSESKLGTYTIYFDLKNTCSNQSTYTLTILEAQSAEFHYLYNGKETTDFCNNWNENDYQVIFTSGGTFSCDNDSVNIDKDTGKIRNLGDLKGKYEIKYSFDYGIPYSDIITVHAPAIDPDSITANHTSYCKNGINTLTLTLNGGSGNEAKWYRNDKIIEDQNQKTLTLTGNDIPNSTTTFRAAWFSEGCGESDTVFKTITVYKKPKITNFYITPDNVCKNSLNADTITLEAVKNSNTAPGGRYYFFKDDTAIINRIYKGSENSYNLAEYQKPNQDTTVYFAKYTDNCGTTNISSKNVYLHDLTIPKDLPGDSTSLCDGETLALSVEGEAGPGNEAINYQWYRNNTILGQSSNSLNLTDPLNGRYYCILSTEYCPEIKSKTEVVHIEDMSYDILEKGKTDSHPDPVLLYSSRDDFDKYQWYYAEKKKFNDADSIEGAVKQYYYPENYDSSFKTGYYFVKAGKFIKAEKLCEEIKSKYVSITGTKEATLYLYPNPSDGNITIQLVNGNSINQNGGTLIRIIDMAGRVVFSNDIPGGKTESTFSVHISEPGVYSLVAYFPDGTRKSLKLLVR